MSEVERYLAKTSEVESAEIETPVVETPEPTGEPVAEPEAAEVAAEEPEASGDDSPETKPAPKKNSFQERISTKTRQAKEAEQRALEAEQRARVLEQRVTELVGDPGEFPSLEQFDYDQGKYTQAVIDYNAKLNQQNIQGALAEQERLTADNAKKSAQTAVVDAFKEKQTAFATEHEDYAQTVSNPALPMGRTITQAVVMADNGPAIAYHLGKNPDVAAEINSLPAPMAMMRIGQLSAQLSTPVIPKQTNAPAPAKTPVAKGSASKKDPENMTTIEYAKHRGYR